MNKRKNNNSKNKDDFDRIIKDNTYGFPAPIDQQQAINILSDYLLGEDFYIEDPLPNCQADTIIVQQILLKYSKEYRKRFKKLRKSRPVGGAMMKGFIEVTDATNNAKRLLNVNHIQEVWGNTIYTLLVENDIQDSVNCQETYEEIKQKIKEAQHYTERFFFKEV